MTNLSSLTGFSSGGGGGGAGQYEGTFLLDTFSWDGSSENRSFEVTNMDSYVQSFRIRGLDTADKAFIGWNSMMRNATTGNGGGMLHVCGLVSVNQSTGAIQKENITTMHSNTGHTSDYSTFTSSGDEWTGRYSYLGHIPRQGQSHTYGYDNCFLYNASGGKDSQHNNNSSYYPSGNRRNSHSYVDVGQRQIGGAVRHMLTCYDGSSHAYGVENYFGASTASINMQATNNGVISSSITSTNYYVLNYCQWDESAEPYYSCFHSMPDGMYVRARSNGGWSQLGNQSDYPMGSRYCAFHLSSGKTLLSDGKVNVLIDTSGNVSTVAATDLKAAHSIMQYSWKESCWNIGQDEWLMIMPDMTALKFKINPNTGAETISNALIVKDIASAAFDNRFSYTHGFWSRFSPGTVNSGGTSATFGNENSNGHGYGKEKLIYLGGDSNGQVIRAASFAIKDLCDTLVYP